MDTMIQQIIISLAGSSITLTIFLVIGGWYLKNRVEKEIEFIFKQKELLLTEVIKKRAEITLSIFNLCKKITSGKMKIGEFITKSDLIDQVAIWFPDETYQIVRDFFAHYLSDPSGSWVNWKSEVEPVLQSLITAVRPESKVIESEGYLLPGFPYKIHFLPNIVTKS